MLFNKLTPMTADAKAKASEFLDSQKARGGTVLKPALAAAFRYGNPTASSTSSSSATA